MPGPTSSTQNHFIYLSSYPLKLKKPMSINNLRANLIHHSSSYLFECQSFINFQAVQLLQPVAKPEFLAGNFINTFN
jgi:hypothetical protein